MTDTKNLTDRCKVEAESLCQMKNRLPEVAERIIASCSEKECLTHIDFEPIPSEGYMIDIIQKLKEVLFPGFFTREKLDPVNLRYNMGQTVSVLFDMLAEQIAHALRHDCFRYNLPCTECASQGQQVALDLLQSIPSIRRILATDVKATFEGDPASKSYDEIIFSYPGILAIMIYRVAHKLYQFQVPLLPRIMTEYAHSVTGIDIHPGAEIGPSFVIDHGTGVVIGETALIGRNVRIYQGVTLGALSLPKGAGQKFKGMKRHPTIEDDAIIYSGATILGGDTIIGTRAVIGGNVWLTKSVPADTKVMLETPRLIYQHNGNENEQKTGT